jgi:serine/threonine protein kinase
VHQGERFGRYEIARLIGRGAMGEVYLAKDMEERRDVALKLVYKGPDAEDQDILNAERLGAELQKRLSGADSRVVVVRRYGEINGDLFIEMEYIEGEDLSGLLSRGPLNPSFAAYVAFELCGMLENLSTFATTIGDRKFLGVVHGDLKPRNIRLNLKNHVKVLDFGIAKALSNTGKYTMNLFASAAYCSPERLESQNMDSQSDLWSVGVLLYQMIAGRLPFEEPTREQLERRIRSSTPPAALPIACPEGLRRIVFKMLARDLSQRYANATEVKEDLARLQRGETVLARAVPVQAFDSDATTRTAGSPSVGRAVPTAQSSDNDKTIRTIPPPPAQAKPRQSLVASSNRIAMGCLGVLGVICLIAVGFAFMQYSFWEDADKLKTDIEAERVTKVNDLWARYQALEKRQHLPGLFHGARGALKRRLMADADSVIND